MAVFSAVGSKEDVWAIIGVDVSGLSSLRTVVGTTVSNLQVIRKHVDGTGVIFEAVKLTGSRVLFGLLHTRFSGEVDKFERVSSTKIREWRWVVSFALFISGIIDTDHFEKFVGENAACI